MPDRKFILKKLSNGMEIPLKADLSVGRSAENGLQLVEGCPSRRHALLSLAAGSAWVQDLGSVNGTYVNDRRIEGKVKLNSNDRLRFDIEEYAFRIESEEAAGDRTIARAAAVDSVADAAQAHVPRWVENAPLDNKTAYMTPEQVAEERRRLRAIGAVDAASVPVEVPQLLVLGSTGEQKRIALRSTNSGRQEWSVGSEGERQILLPRVGVSALHAKIVNDGDKWRVIDQLSANGTFVNGTRCTVSALSSGDRVGFGPVECIFQLPDDRAATRVAAAVTTTSGGLRVKKILLIAAGTFLVTLAVLFYVLRKQSG
jgi:pSer/pThr/pTyr-binding forkhead associated (FHA) protein